METRPAQRTLLVTADGDLGGGALLVLHFARHLHANGWDVHLATTPDTWLAAEAARAGIVVHPGRYRHARTDPRAMLDLRDTVRTVRPSIIHAHGTRSMFHTLVLGRPTLGRPVVVHTVHGIHALHHREPGRTLGLLAQRASSVAATSTTYVSDAERDLARRHRLVAPGHDVRVIRNGTADPTLAANPTTRHVVWVGRMVDQKDPLLGARTAIALAASGHVITMVGDGPLLEQARSLVDESPVRDRVVLAGRLDAARTEEVVSSADVMLMTSAWEGLPLVALEAFRYGIPVVGADGDGVRETLTPAAGATVTPARTSTSLAEAVERITSDRSERARRSSLAKATWDARHRLSDCLQAYTDLYGDHLGRAPTIATTRRISDAGPSLADSHSLDCSIVIVNFNGGELVREAAASACRAGREAGRSVEVLVIDNASHDGSPEALEQDPGVTLVRSGANVGFPAACNIGIGRSRGRIILLLNPDARIDGRALRVGLEALERSPGIGLLGLGQTDPTGRPLPVTYAIPSISAYLRRQLLARVDCDAERPLSFVVGTIEGEPVVEVDGYLSGACLFARRADLLRLDGLDDRLFWAEDADLCRRVRSSGATVALVPGVHVVHAASSTRNRFLDLALFQQYRGYLRYVHTHDGTPRALGLAAMMALEIVAKWTVASFLRDSPSRLRRRAYRAVLPALPRWAIGRLDPVRLEPLGNERALEPDARRFDLRSDTARHQERLSVDE